MHTEVEDSLTALLTERAGLLHGRRGGGRGPRHPNRRCSALAGDTIYERTEVSIFASFSSPTPGTGVVYSKLKEISDLGLLKMP